MINSEYLKKYIVDVPNFPKDGILFKDISPLISNAFGSTIGCMSGIIDLVYVDKFIGIESRGFIFAAGLAAYTQRGVVMARKKGKLPNATYSLSYDLEYGSDTIEMQAGSGSVCIVDDVLATGYTMQATKELAEKAGYRVVNMVTLINLKNLNNASVCNNVRSLLEYV